MMTEHTVKSFDQELRDLALHVAEMGGLVEKQIQDAGDGLVARNEALSEAAISADDAADSLAHRIEGLTVVLLARRQPMAGDLREVVTALRISIDLERIGDFAKNIGKRLAPIKDDIYPDYLMKRVEQMADLARGQLRDVLDSYLRGDAAKAVEVWRRDEQIDATYSSSFRERLTYMMEAPRNISFSAHMRFCAKNIERIGDHTINIGETVYYMVEGVALKEGRPKGDTTSFGIYAP
jgi:phosphate transport system protein